MPMIEKLLPAAALLVLSTMVQPATAQPTPRSTAMSTSDTVLVAPPTGERAADRASIEAALGAVQPGGTVQFAPGTYLIGEFIRVSVPRVTLQGHADGTTLRGCEPERFDLPDGFGMEEVGVVAMGCTGLHLIADRQTVRGLTFEHAWQALWIGCCLDPAEDGEAIEPSHVGGHLIEGNTFRASVNGFRVIGDSPEPVVIRDNDFVNVWHAGGVNGRTAHILGNRISVPDAAQVPPNGFPGLALFITPYDTRLERAFTCAGNVIAGNRVEGHPEGIAIMVFGSGASCGENVIRDNTVAVSRVRFSGSPWGVCGIRDQTDSTLAGVPITLADLRMEIGECFGLPVSDEPGDENLIHDNLIAGNRIVGGEGLGIEVLRASGNRIVDNTITGITARDPFPGNTMYVPPAWSAANGSGIWVSPGSDDNEIVGNTFEDVAGDAVVIEGDGNRVELRGPTDAVRDLGSGNRVIGLEPDGEAVGDREQPTAQDAQSPIVDARFADVGGLRLEYFSFGDSGIPVVWVQDHHDYFREATFGPEQAEEWVAFLERFADAFRALAPVRRGWGASDDPGYGFDVATQAEDLVGLLDALGIDRAVFVGRTIATQELTWVAEHHPERVIGLVYLGTPHVTGTGQFATPTPAVERWAEMYNRVACDIGTGNEVDRRLQPRNAFRAHFTEDPDVRINIPTLLSLHPLIDREGHNLRRLDWLEAGELGGDEACDAEAGAYFDELARSPARIAELRRAFQEEANALVRVRERMERAFGDRLTVVWEPDEFGLEPWYASIRPFLESLNRQVFR